MPEPTKPKSTKAKATKTKAVNPPQAASKMETAEEAPYVEPPSNTTTSFRASPRISGIFTGIREHWQFTLTFIVACVGTWLLLNQNDLLGSQNSLLKNQNTLIQHQMSLEEASRRSALVMLMSNIMDKVDDEIKEQKNALRSKGISKTAVDTMKFSLSQSLIGQIAALSHSFKPYKFMDGDTIISKPISPERGQLLITLTRLPLDTSTLNKIFQGSTFAESDLREAKLRGASLTGADLNGADLKGADLGEADMGEADMGGADLKGANLSKANLSKAYLNDTDLKWAEFFETVLIEADLRRADLRNVELGGAHLSGAHLSEANLRGADLMWMDFCGVDLMDADLRGANLREANLNE
ncbi:MAG: pentapeptide repeat-containing protein, partial [Saprospiraceae bacterium]